MIPRLRTEDGYAVPIAIMLMVIMLGFGFAALGFVDGETNSSRVERTHEARLNLTEGVLAAQIFQLSRGWPSAVEKQMPVNCTQTATEAGCPQPAQLEGQFQQVDIETLSPEWSVQVRDDDATIANPAAGQFYDDATVLDNPRWDENVNGEMWVRAEAELNGKPRVLVARIRVEQRPVTPPAAPFVAGSFQTGNNSPNKVIISSTVPGVVRCPDPADSACIKYVSGQISPVNKVESNPDLGSVLGDGMAEALKQTAIAKKTYYATCADIPGGNPTGDVVWVESGDCTFQGNMTVNGTTKRGVFVLNNGTFHLRGGVQWWGMIYMLNTQGCGSVAGASPCIGSDGVADITGTPTIFGGLFIEGAGRLSTGNSGGNGNCQQCDPQIIYRPESGSPVTAYGTAGIIQNTWRELLPK